MRQGFIYCITNNVNGKRYIGQTVTTIGRRWSVHKHDSKKGSHYILHRAMRKHGAENFSIEEVAQTLEPFLNNLEAVFVRLFNTHVDNRNGYNCTVGGDGRGMTSRDTRKKLSIKGKEYWTPDNRKARSEKYKGIDRLSPEARQRSANSLRGMPKSEDHKKKLREYQNNRPTEHNRNISRAKMGKPVHENTRRALLQAAKQPKSPEARKRMSGAAINRWTDERRQRQSDIRKASWALGGSRRILDDQRKAAKQLREY